MAVTEWEICRTAIGQENIKVIFCDDDPAFSEKLREELCGVLSRMNMQAEIAIFNSPADLTPEKFASCDMAFFDIDFEHEDCNGIDIARKLRQVNDRALLFFVTNYIEYAPEGFEVQAFRYILKRDMSGVLERYILQALGNMAEGQEYLRLQNRDETVDIPLEQVAYLEVMGHYVSIHAGDASFELSATLSSLEERLEGHGFLRIHKSFLVNMRHIRRFRSRECLLLNGTVLTVSDKNYSQQKQKYLLWKGLK